ncbi:formate dehydrogenase accessory sulfurtransferase FdhD [Hyphomicrobium methylovorum]|uniref:formate dehydrogenase accessory sulfurtransferase FdhD n=1 Tax=Hyphomicrobium methylovorum TaxID=84 RepID=UPI0015E6503C|nr:formate dehydrogenase accessory sulfurtransferase FdhD [Hyphomicrobium methylovorum]MBA2127031.1 formate dehydrogenase accessory sulfurtransferase FdhD [Hyphomicrobium methylovorum]
MSVMPKAVTHDGGGESLCSRPASGVTSLAGEAERVTWQLPEETPVALQINSEPYTVMMATPADLRDFAVGFLIGEGILKSPRSIVGVLVMPVDNGVAVDVAIPETELETTRLARRTVEGRTGCGLCGIEDISSALRPLPVLTRTWAPSPDAIERAASSLYQHQPMNQLNRSVHGAAWVSREGEILLVREDVGRHNALDKLIGALLRDETDLTNGFVLMTSRCSFELVQKTVTAGIGGLVTVSAPTALALDLAKKSNLFLAALAKGRAVIFNA